MKLLHIIGRGIGLGLLTDLIGSVFAVIPAAIMVFSMPQAVSEPDNNIINVALMITLPTIYFFLHLIPVILSGILVSYLWGRFFFSPLMKMLVAFPVILAASICVAWIYTIVSSAGFSEYTSIDYILVVGTGSSYTVAFMLLARKVLSSSERNENGNTP